MGEAVLLEDLQVGYDGEPVCAAVTAAVAPGRCVALVGSNGAGKTTLLKAVLGRLEPLQGRVRVLGRGVDERDAEFRRDVAAVMDDDAYFPHLTVREHLDLVARAFGTRDVEAVVDAEVDALALDRVGDALPLGLSSGQRRRFLLAAAFVRPRRLLVLDEPEQRLDVSGRRLLVRRLRAETAAGGTVLLATHDPEVLAGACDAVLLLADAVSEVVDVDAALAALAGAPTDR